MKQPRAIALTDNQMMLVQRAARTLLPEARDGFLRGVAARLGAEPTDVAVHAAVYEQLASGRLPVFISDAKQKDSKP